MVYTIIFDAKPVVNNAFKNPHLRIRRVLQFFHVDKVYIDIKKIKVIARKFGFPGSLSYINGINKELKTKLNL